MTYHFYKLDEKLIIYKTYIKIKQKELMYEKIKSKLLLFNICINLFSNDYYYI